MSKTPESAKKFIDSLAEPDTPRTIGKKIAEELLARNGFMLYKTDESESLHYAEACAAYGAAKFASSTGDTDLLRRIFNRYKDVAENGPVNSENHVDANVYGIVPLELYLRLKNKKMLKEGLHLADKQWLNPRPDGLTNQTRFWVDDVYMTACLQVQAYRSTRNYVYLERAALEVETYLKKLQQENGLFFHGPEAQFYWGRGNGWVAAGLTELLSELPATDSRYTSILGSYRTMMKSLVEYQGDDGMWHQLIDIPSSFAESSSTAMFGYAVCEGVSKGLLTGEEYTTCYQRAWKALCRRIDGQSRVTDICVGTGQSKDMAYYLERPTHTGDFHGQAPMLWFACSLIKD